MWKSFNTVRHSRDQDRDYTFSLTFVTSTVLLTTLKIAVFGEKCKSSPLQKEKHRHFVTDVLSHKR